MAIQNQNNFINALKNLGEQKKIPTEELTDYLIEVFKKAFEKDDSKINSFNKVNVVYEPANVDVKVNIDEGLIRVWKSYEIVEEIIDEKDKFNQIEISNEKLKDSSYKIGDNFVEEVDLLNLTFGKVQYIKQLLIQKTREAEKFKIYDQFKNKKGEIISAKVFKIHDNYVIFEYEGASVFVSKSELSDLDKFKVGELVKIFITDVAKVSKDAQIIGSRTNIEFVKKLIEYEIEDVEDQIVTIDKIARIPGVKTKIIVSSKLPEVDAIGTIIGLKGKKIKPIIDELRGERIDVIKNSSDIRDILDQALLPSKLEGIFIRELENGKNEYVLVVKKEAFLSALGKRGLNVKLVANLVNAKIDIKTIEEANAENIKWEKYQSNLRSRVEKVKEKTNFNVDNFDLEDYEILGDEYN